MATARPLLHTFNSVSVLKWLEYLMLGQYSTLPTCSYVLLPLAAQQLVQEHYKITQIPVLPDLESVADMVLRHTESDGSQLTVCYWKNKVWIFKNQVWIFYTSAEFTDA